MMVNYFPWNWHNCWSLLQRLITEGELDIMLSLRAMSWSSELEYDRIEALEVEAEWEADKVRQMDVWLDDEFTKSLWLGGVSLRSREASVIVTSCWLEGEFQDSSQRGEAALEGWKERLLAFLEQEGSLKPWLEEHFVRDLNAADFKLLRRDMAKVWSESDEDPMAAADTIVVVEDWCFRHLIFLQG